MKMAAALFATCAAPVAAETVRCDLDGTALSFPIDMAQFAPPQNPAEPPQRRLTTVTMGAAKFPAEPVVMDGARGFWAEDVNGAELLMIMQPDGAAVLSNSTTNDRLTGTCTVTQ